jgi:hypothetical protein
MAGDLVVDQSVLRREILPPFIRDHLDDHDRNSWRERFRQARFPLYEIVSIVKWRFLWHTWRHYAALCRLSDGKILRINLKSPSSGLFKIRTSDDTRFQFALLRELLGFYREVVASGKQKESVALTPSTCDA